MIEVRYENAGISEGRSEISTFTRALAARTLDNLGWKSAAVTVLFCSTEKIRQLNRDYRHLDEPTDVLSFPAHDDVSSVSREPGVYLGDLAICLPYMIDHAKSQGREPGDELALLVVHGILHLLGWNHDNKLNEKRMWKEQDRLLELVKDLQVPKVG